MDTECCNSVNTILHKLVRSHFIWMHNELEKLGLYPGQPQILLSLEKKNGQSQRELADLRSVRASTNTVMLNRMEKTGLIEKKKDSEDQRITRIFLTDKGLEICEKLNQIHDDFERNSMKGFSEEEKIVLRRLLLQVIDNIKVNNGDMSLEDFHRHRHPKHP